MKILMVQQYLGRPEPPVMPVGLACLAGALPRTYDVKLLDMNTREEPYAALEQVLGEFKPEVVALSIRNIDSQQRMDLFYYYLEVPKTLALVRRVLPKAKVVVGGAGFSMFPRTIMERNPEIDFGLYLEGEETFPALLESLQSPESVANLYFRKDGEVRFTKPGTFVDMEKMPMPRHDILDMDFYKKEKWAVGVNTKRGCPYRCAYCNYYTLNGLKLRTRPANMIVDEVEHLVKVYGVESFLFADGVFSNPYSHVKEICSEIKRRELKVKWGAWCDVKDITEEFLETVTSAGCDFIVVSPDAFSNEALAGLNKGITEAEVRRALKLLSRQPGLKFGFGFFFTAPGETLLGYFKTLFFYLPFVAGLMLRRKGGGGFSWVRVEPDTKVYEVALKEGIVKPDTVLLPENVEGLKKLFYINPRLKWLDPLSRAVVGAIKLKKLLTGKG